MHVWAGRGQHWEMRLTLLTPDAHATLPVSMAAPQEVLLIGKGEGCNGRAEAGTEGHRE